MGNRPRRKATGNPAEPDDVWVTCRKVLIEELVNENAGLRARLAAVESLCERVLNGPHPDLPRAQGERYVAAVVRAAARGEGEQ